MIPSGSRLMFAANQMAKLEPPHPDEAQREIQLMTGRKVWKAGCYCTYCAVARAEFKEFEDC